MDGITLTVLMLTLALMLLPLMMPHKRRRPSQPCPCGECQGRPRCRQTVKIHMKREAARAQSAPSNHDQPAERARAAELGGAESADEEYPNEAESNSLWAKAISAGPVTVPSVSLEALTLIALAVTVGQSMTNTQIASTWALVCLLLPTPNTAPDVKAFLRMLRRQEGIPAPRKIDLCRRECRLYENGDLATECNRCHHPRFKRKRLPYHVRSRTHTRAHRRCPSQFKYVWDPIELLQAFLDREEILENLSWKHAPECVYIDRVCSCRVFRWFVVSVTCTESPRGCRFGKPTRISLMRPSVSA
jgi:hypothetical protein